MCQRRDRLNQIHTLKPNRLEAETRVGLRCQGVTMWQKLLPGSITWPEPTGIEHGRRWRLLQRYSGENGWSAPIKTNVINVTGGAMP